MAQAILRETTTNGVRSRRCRKYILLPSCKTIDTPYGPIRVKHADRGDLLHEKPEYDDVAAAARKSGLPFQKVWEDVLTKIKEEPHE